MTRATAAPAAGGGPRIARVVGMLGALYGIALALAGGALLAKGGSPYYFLAGLGTTLAGMMVAASRCEGAYVYVIVILGSIAWAWLEAGFAMWLFLPRVGPPLVIGLLLSLPWLLANAQRKRYVAVIVIFVGVALALAGYLNSRTEGATPATGDDVLTEYPGAADEWPSFANGNAGLRFSTAQQITAQNVQRLRVAWIHRSGEDPLTRANLRNLPAYEATPIKVGPTLYLCTPRNQVIAVDAESGAERWRHDPQTDTSGASYLLACRGVSYYESESDSGICPRRIIAGTGDGRLIALDANSGKPCLDFGERGTVSLRRNLGEVLPGSYSMTSAPLVTGGTIVVGALVVDNLSLDVPSGVVRAYDTESGRQLWSFDTGAAEPTMVGEPSRDLVYTRGSPNAWAPFSADEERGLVFIPTGNASPDYFGSTRNPAMARFGSSVLALEARTGRLRWVFQTVHHDVWDYDVAAQPLLLDFPMSQGVVVPALIQPTKRGDLFVLDRRSGEPLTPVVERAVPQRGVAEDLLAPTQPFSIGMPFLGPEPRTESSMWGVTPFDEIWCRMRFHELRYEGSFTPPSVDETLQSPNQTGASNWGRVSIDTARNILVANTVNLDSIVRLIPRADAERVAAAGKMPVFPQIGTPYASSYRQFLSPLGIPCNAPPWGEIRAIDLATRQTLWRKPFGTVRDRLPLPLPIELGLPSVGGPLTTASGLSFIAAADDGYLRAYDTRSGDVLWSSRLPASAQAAPMTYVSGTSGRQFVVIAAGGDVRLGSRTGDYLVAFALTDEMSEP